MRLGCRIFRLFEGDWEKAFDYAVRHALDSIQIEGVQDEELPMLQEHINRTGVQISSLGPMSRSMLGPDLRQSLIDQERAKKQIQQASRLGVPVVSQFAGNDPSNSFKENIEVFAKVFAPLARYAEDHGVKIVIENCPLVEKPTLAVQNLAYSPYAWDAIFEAVPSPALGLEFDTAHLPMLGIDIGRCLEEYKEKIYHVHIKDCRIDPEDVYRHGRIGTEFYRYEVPGKGDIDFKQVISTLRRLKYQGDVTLDLRPTTFETIEQGIAYMKPILKSEV